jgi:hypothetical protein
VEAWLEYFHRNPTSHRRLQKGILVPGGTTGPPVTGGHKYRDIGFKVGGSTQY